MPPYGLISIAGMLPASFQVKLYDENIRSLRDEELAKADLVMASAMIVQKDSLQDLIARCNRLGKPIMVGGPLINTGFEDVPDAAHYFIGEAEQGLPQFISDFLAGRAKKAYDFTHGQREAFRSGIAAQFRQVRQQFPHVAARCFHPDQCFTAARNFGMIVATATG